MKKFTFCSLLDYLKGLDTTQKPVEISTATIRVVLVPKMNTAGSSTSAMRDKSTALVAAFALTHVLAPPELQ
jgi:hypothetical protein